MKQSSSESNSCLISRDVPALLWNLKALYQLQRSLSENYPPEICRTVHETLVIRNGAITVEVFVF
jgi:hypothetical protein